MLSAIGAPTYKKVRLFLPLLKDLTFNACSAKDSVDSSREILQQNSNLFMASLDITSLFINISFDETTNTCLKEPFVNYQFVSNWKLATKESFFHFSLFINS